MTLKQIIKKERKVWHDRFIPSMVAAGVVLIMTLLFQWSGFDIVLLTSISASIVILTSKEKHRLTVAGTAIYSYLVAAIIGFIFLAVQQKWQLDISILAFITISLIVLAMYMLNIFHPPAVGIALGIILYSGPINILLLILVFTFAMFVLVKVIMYAYYKGLVLKEFHHEFLVWDKKLFK